MDRIAVGSVTLAVEQWPGPVPAPAGSAIVCIHGLTANHVCWASVADVLSPAHRLIAYDLRGRGESDKPARGYSLAHHGEDLEGLLDHFGLRKAVLIGHSLGAHIALRFAATRPARVSKLVLVDGGLDVRAEVLDSLRPAINRLGVEFPSSWSLNATNIVAQKYFRGTLGTPEREWSLRQVIDRVADTITRWGVEGGYFLDDDEADSFNAELKYLLVTQRAAFNSPVWFNIGVKGVPQQASACFILSVDDSMDSILNWYREEGVIFKGGSGAGVNLSRIRSSVELLKGGGSVKCCTLEVYS